MDGKAAGESPLTLETVSPGRHVVTFVGTGGSLKRTIKVEGGRSLALDVPLFSGFAAISAPFVIDVSEGGKALGTSDDQIILWPGHHELHLANKALGYSATRPPDGTWRNIRVHVKSHDDYRTRARRGYYADPAKS